MQRIFLESEQTCDSLAEALVLLNDEIGTFGESYVRFATTNNDH